MMTDPYSRCVLCPRFCGADRRGMDAAAPGGPGFCGETAELRIASAGIHRGEEPPLAGKGGSGTVFVTGCNLGCVFCQNRQISRQAMGRPVTAEEFGDICLVLREKDVENINIVTGSHAVPAIAEGLASAKQRGLDIPVLWNSSGYENTETLALLETLVDVWLPDLKTLDVSLADRYFHAPDYPQAAERAITRMLEYRPSVKYDSRGVMIGGVIIRHLILPGSAGAVRDVIRWFAEHCAGRALLSLMTQYTPAGVDSTDAPEHGSAPSRYVSSAEYDSALDWLEEYGVDDGFLQDLVQDGSWLPRFDRANPFSPELFLPVWHWKTGFAA